MQKCIFAMVAFGAALLGSSTELRLIDAVKQKDSVAVRSLLNQRADVNDADPDGTTALHWAVHLDDVQTARALIDAGANVKAPNRYGVTPMLLACENGSAAIVDMLLKAGADPNTANPNGETALMVAARTGKPAPVKLLLVSGAKVNAKENWRGQTALMWAAAEGHTAVVEQLIEFGADIHARSNGGFTPFLFAVREGKTDVVRTLLKAGSDVNETLPIRLRRRPAGPDASANAKPGASALHLAVGNAHFELAAMLLEAGANPNADGPGWTPLHVVTWVRKPGYASNDPAPPGSGKMESLEFVRKMAEHKANLNARMTNRTTAGLSSLNMVGATPFLMAARTGDAELMRLFAQLGADPLLPNQDGSTPLIVAAGLGTRSPGEDAGTEAEAVEAVKVALELGNDINAVDKNGDTAMHGAAYKQLPAVVLLLAERGADIRVWNNKDNNGWTPLRIAEGVHRTGNFRSSPETAAVFRKIMAAAGVSTEVEPESDVSGYGKK